MVCQRGCISIDPIGDQSCRIEVIEPCQRVCRYFKSGLPCGYPSGEPQGGFASAGAGDDDGRCGRRREKPGRCDRAGRDLIGPIGPWPVAACVDVHDARGDALWLGWLLSRDGPSDAQDASRSSGPAADREVALDRFDR